MRPMEGPVAGGPVVSVDAGVASAPDLVGVFRAGGGVTVRFRGGRRESEVRRVELPAGTVVTIGQCFADEAQLKRGADLALRSGDASVLTRWPGAYACLVLRADEVTLLEDVAGQYPLYYRHSEGQLWFADRPAAVAEAAGREPRPDPRVLAAWVLCPGVPLTGDSAPVDGVRRLGGGHALRFDARSAPRRWAYEPLLPGGSRSAADTAEAVREALDTAVRVRAARTGRLTCDFSGGMDSTSLAFLALAHRPGDLGAFVYHHPSSPDDLPYARRYARLDRRLRLETVTGVRGTLSFQGLEHSGFTGETEPGAASLARTRLRLRHIASLDGAGVHLGGEGGDALFAAPAAYLADLVCSGGLRRLRGDAWVLARQRHASPAAVLTRAVRLSRTPMATALLRLAERLERPEERDVTWLDTVAWWPEPGGETGWFTPSARRDLAELARLRAEAPDGGPHLSPAEHWTRHELHTSAAAQRYLSACAREFGVWPQAPYLDHNVVRACLALPVHLRAGPPAPKPLLATALSGRVPAEVLARRTKGDYSAEDYGGARAASAELRSLLASSRLAELGIIEPAAVRASLGQASLGVRTAFPALTRLLAVEVGLRGATRP